MKTIRKAFAFILALALMLAMATTAFAAQEATITITNSNTSVSMVGHTYKAYRVMDLSWDGKQAYAYTMNADFKAFFDAKGVTTDAAANTYINAQKDNMQAFAKELLDYVTTNSIAAKATEKATGESVKLKPDALGWYLVTDAGAGEDPTTEQNVVAALALTTTDYNGEISLKADAPKIDKKIVENGSEVEANNAAVGDVVNFKITSAVPDMTGYTKYFFVINDTLSKGLTFNTNPAMAITIGDKTLTADTDYTISWATSQTDGTTAIEIVIKDFVNYKKGAAITVTYSATVNDQAVIGTAGNPNTVTLTYSNNPTVTPVGDTANPDKPGAGMPTGTTPAQHTITYVTGIKLAKEDPNHNKLTGAQFKIEGDALNKVIVYKDAFTAAESGTYYKLKDGTYTTAAPNGNDDLYESTTQKYTRTTVKETQTTESHVTTTATVDDDGILRIDGLAEGTYTITEIKAPAGYNLLTSPITLEITCTEPTTVTAGTETCTWSATVDKKAATIENGIVTFSVVNNTGAELPSTGGMGTQIFYIIGGILMLGAIVLLVVRKKLSAKQD